MTDTQKAPAPSIHAQQAGKALSEAEERARDAKREAGRAVAKLSEAGREAAKEARDRVETNARKAQETLEAVTDSAKRHLEGQKEIARQGYDALAETSSAVTEESRDFVRRHPLGTLFAVGGVALLIGRIAGARARRDDTDR